MDRIPFNPNGMAFEIPAGKPGSYRDAQWDDYSYLKRWQFPHNPPLSLTLQARVSDNSLPGTWGFGFWNDPFSLGLGIKGSGTRLPALPEAAWFFYASPRSDLSFKAKKPANGFFTTVFTSVKLPGILLPFGLPFLPLLAVKPTARLIRRIAASLIHENSHSLNLDCTIWHSYQLDWLEDEVRFWVDGKIIHSSNLSPRAPLGLIIWIDNQYATFSADGAVRFGTEENPSEAWLEVRDIEIDQASNNTS